MNYLISIIFIIGIFSILPLAIAQGSGAPDWVKNNAMWWAEGKISEKEYLDAVKFLVENKIINIETSSPMIKPEEETDTVSKNVPFLEAAKVRFSSGDFTEELTLDTFARFNAGKDNSYLPELRELGLASYFVFESLPSKDKADVYKLISRYINPGRTPLPFDVSISAIMSDGTTLLTESYKKCQVNEYSIYTQDLAINYQYTNEKQEEIRDKIQFICGGVAIGEIANTFPEIDFTIEESLENNSLEETTDGYYVIPNDNDRAMSFVVHFFDGELPELRSFDTFKVFSPQNPLNPSPQFSLESLPTKDKKGFYDFLSRYINPGKVPEKFKVSVDMVSGDGTILQRWNYAKCEVIDYTMHLQEYIFRYSFSGEEISEILEKTDFKCGGLNWKVHGHDTIKEIPIVAVDFQKSSIQSQFADSSLKQEDRAMSYAIHTFGGDLEDTRTLTNFQKFEALSSKRPNIPANHPKQYEYGFFVESNPSFDKTEDYEYLIRYINAGKPPEPFSVNVDVITGDGTVLHTLKYTKCSALDFEWYYQEYIFFPTLTGVPNPEIRERYTVYCEGLTVEVP